MQLEFISKGKLRKEAYQLQNQYHHGHLQRKRSPKPISFHCKERKFFAKNKKLRLAK